VRQKSRREAEVVLVDQPEWMTSALAPLPVADRLVRTHPAVAALAQDREHRLVFRAAVRKRGPGLVGRGRAGS